MLSRLLYRGQHTHKNVSGVLRVNLFHIEAHLKHFRDNQYYNNVSVCECVCTQYKQFFPLY